MINKIVYAVTTLDGVREGAPAENVTYTLNLWYRLKKNGTHTTVRLDGAPGSHVLSVLASTP
jgi:hypothetical protein